MNEPSSRSARLWLAALVVYCSGIFWGSSLSRPPGLAQVEQHFSDKVVHATAFMGMAILAIHYARARFPQRPLNMHLAAGVIFTSVYGISDEIHQRFTPGRAAEVLDAVADTTGACIAALLVYAVVRFRTPSR